MHGVCHSEPNRTPMRHNNPFRDDRVVDPIAENGRNILLPTLERNGWTWHTVCWKGVGYVFETRPSETIERCFANFEDFWRRSNTMRPVKHFEKGLTYVAKGLFGAIR